MSEASWREGWGYTGPAAVRVRKPEHKEDEVLAPRSPKHSRWAKKSEIEANFVRCEMRGKDTVIEKGGFPVWSDGSVSYLDTSPNHILIVAATNRHKTRGALMPTVAVTAMERNVSYVIHDPKGELYWYLSGLLRSLGIEVKVVNFRDPECGDCWNMLSVPYRLWKSGKVSAAKAILTDVAALLSPIDPKTSNDLFWPSAGQYTLLGFMYALMELSDREEEANFSNLLSIIRSATVDIDKFNEFVDMFDKDSDVVTMLSSAINNGDTTRKCIMGMVYNALAKLVCNESLASMMASNQIDLAEVGVKPTAVFLITPDEKNTYNPLVGQFVSQAYQELIAKAQSLGGRLPLRVNFLLDEFASLDRIEGIPDMLAAGRSRNIRCMLVIQSVAQLRAVYGDITPSITNNCADWVYLGGRDTEFMDRLCALAGNDDRGQPIVTTTQLMHLEKGRESFVMIDGSYPFIGRIADISEYDVGDVTFSTPEMRKDHKAPLVIGEKVFTRKRKAPKKTEDRRTVDYQSIFSSFDDCGRLMLGPTSNNRDIERIISKYHLTGDKHDRAYELLESIARSITKPVDAVDLIAKLGDTRYHYEMDILVNSLELRPGVQRTRIRKTLDQLDALIG